GEKSIPNSTPLKGRVKRVLSFVVCGVAICGAVVIPISDHFLLFCLLSAPLVAAALQYGNPGVAGTLATFGCFVIAADRYHHGFEDKFGTQMVVIVSAMNALALGSTVSRSRRTDKTTQRQAALLNSVRFATDHLLAMTDRAQTVTAVLQNLAVEADMARSYVLENRAQAGGSTQPLYEYWRLPSPLAEPESRFLDRIIRDRIKNYASTLSEGNVVQYRTIDLPEEDQEGHGEHGIHAAIIRAIFVA